MKRRATPNLLQLRLAKGLTQEALAAAAGISRYAYQKIERGDSVPRIATISEIAQALGVSLADLAADVGIPQVVRFRDCGRMKSRMQLLLETAAWARAYADLERRLRRTRDFVLDQLIAACRREPSGRQRAVRAAVLARKTLSLSADEPVRDLCVLLEAAGVKVCSQTVSSPNFFGFSIGRCEIGPVIVVNVWERIPVERRIFTAARELGHLLLHPEGYEVTATGGDRSQENEADAFACHFLMPEEAFGAKWDDTRGLSFLERVMKIKRIYRLSYRTVLYRIAAGTGIGHDAWTRFRREYEKRYGRALRLKEEPHTSEPADLVPSDFLPERLPRLVRQAVEQGELSLDNGAAILGLDLPSMEDLVSSWAD